MTIYDQLTDPGLNYIAEAIPFVNASQRDKLASALAGQAPVNPDLYAAHLRGRALMPVDTPLNVILSHAYFSKQAHLFKPEERTRTAEKIARAASILGVELEKTAMTVKSDAGPETRFALVKHGRGYYPLRNTKEIQKASDYFTKHAAEFEPLDRMAFAIRTARAAVEAGLPVSPDLEKYAGTRMSRDAAIRIAARGEAAPGFREEYQALAESVGKLNPRFAATLLHDMDKISGISRHWNRGVFSDPVLTIFEKSAAEDPPGDTAEEKLSRAAAEGRFDGILDRESISLLTTHPKQFLVSVNPSVVEALNRIANI